MIDTERKISRAGFFRILAGILLLPAGFLSWFSVAGERKTYGKPRTLKLKDIKKGFYCSDDVLVSNINELKFFSPRCTHLGCSIKNVAGGVAVCPCHGSKFDENGIPVSGPASKPLAGLKYTINSESGEITVYEKNGV